MMKFVNILILFISMFGNILSQSFPSGCPDTVISNALITYDACLQHIMTQLFQTAPFRENLANYLQRYCDLTMKQDLDGCQNTLQKTLTACANEKQTQLLNTMKYANKEGIQYLCQNSGTKLLEFRQGDGAKCLSETIREQNQCVRQHPLLSMYIQEYSTNFCTIQQTQGLLCLKGAIKSSSCSTNSVDFLTAYYQSMVDATPCAGCAMKLSFMLVLISSLFTLFIWRS